MPDIARLAPLLFSPDLAHLTLSGRFRRRRRDAGPDQDVEVAGSVVIAPGGRYRAEVIDDGERILTFSDGVWSWIVSETSNAIARKEAFPVPCGELIHPSWILADFDLQVTGQIEHFGRGAYTAEASRRSTSRSRKNFHRRGDNVRVLIDAELGILLRYEISLAEKIIEMAEFVDLHVSPGMPDPAMFAPPPGVSFEDWRDESGAKARPTQADAIQPVPSDLVNLLYGAVHSLRFAAELHEISDAGEIAQSLRSIASSTANPLAARAGRFIANPAPEIRELTARLQVDMPARYRIEAITEPGAGPICISSDGTRLWSVYPDRVVISRASPPPAGIALLIDPAWLLYGYRLRVQDTVPVSDRRGLQITAEPLGVVAEEGQGPLSGASVPADRIEIIVDLQFGIVLRQEWYFQGKMLLRTELTAVTEDVDPNLFRIDPGPGVRIVEGDGPLHGVPLSALAKDTVRKASLVTSGIARWMGKSPRP